MITDYTPQDWASKLSGETEFAHLDTVFTNEVDAAHHIYSFKSTRDAAKAYLKDLKIIVYCDADEADRLRQEANGLYKEQEDLAEAAIVYTRAIYKAPKGSTSLARAHANRAAVLYKLHAYEAAYEDCTCALEFNHPNTEAVVSRQAAVAWKLKNRQKLQDCIERLEGLNTSPSSLIDGYRKGLTKIKPIITSQSVTSLHPSKSKKVKMLYSEDRGRYLVADEPIDANEVIMEDKATVFTPYDENTDTHIRFLTTDENDLVFTCDNCAESDIVPFPCYECRAAFYCSRKCQQDHLPIHRFECNGSKMGLFNHLNHEHAAFRCLVTFFDHLLGKLRDLQQPTEIRSATELWPTILKICKDHKLLGLYSNFEFYQESGKILRDGLLVSLLCCYLSHQTDFFKRTYHERSTLMSSEFEWRVLVTGLLLRFINMAIFNIATSNQLKANDAFAAEFVFENGLFKSLEVMNDVSTLFPRVSYINHSCISNTLLQHSNLKLTLLSRVPIARGEEITIDYMSNSALQSRDHRWKRLETYAFTCDCIRCKDEEGAICVRATGAICECGGICLLCNSDAACSQCGKHSYAEYYSASIEECHLLDDLPETFIYLYGTYSMLKNVLANNGVLVLARGAAKVLTKYLHVFDEQIYDNEQINTFMVKMAVDLLQMTRNEYVNPLERATYAAMLLDLLVLRNERDFPELSLQCQNLIKETFWIITGKERKMFDDYYQSYYT